LPSTLKFVSFYGIITPEGGFSLMDDKSRFVLTESGLLVDLAPMEEGKGPFEFSEGAWRPARDSLNTDDVFNGIALSTWEAKELILSGKFGNPSQD